MDNRIDLGPASILAPNGSPFAVSAAQWRAIGAFLDGVNGTDAASTAAIAAQLPAYATLRACAASWNTRTHPNLVTLAQQIASYGDYFARELGPRLRALLAAPGGAQQGPLIDTLLQPAIATAQRCSALADALVGDLRVLSTTCATIQNALPGVISALTAQSVGVPGMGDASGLAARLAAQIATIAANLAQVAVLYGVAGSIPLADIERLRGAWGGIGDDLALLKQDLATPVTGELPVLADLNLQVASNQWQNVAAEATAFAAEA